MKKITALILASVMMLTSNSFAEVGQENYPLKSNFPNGIAPFSESITSVAMEKRQFDCSYERYHEMIKIEQDNCSGQREIVDNSYLGQFALKISQSSDEFIPICEGVNFYIPEGHVSNNGNENANNSFTSQDITVSNNGTSVSVSGISDPNTDVCIVAKQGSIIKYINQYTADGSGNFEFNFNISDYGDYNIIISRVNRPSFSYNFSFYPQIVNQLSEQGKTKNNRIRLQLKPMENAKNISFYAKAIVDNEGSLTEEHILLTGKKVENGVFRVGSELSQGKWQEVELYTEYDSSVVLNSISDIYVKANTASNWIIDDIVTDYIGIKETVLDLSNAATDNIIYQDGLQFSKNIQDGKYNNEAKVLTLGTEISGKLNDISVNSIVQNSLQSGNSSNQRELLLDSDFSSNDWTVFCNDDTMLTVGNSKKSNGSIIMTSNGIVDFNSGDFSSDTRVTLEIKSKFDQGSNNSTKLNVKLYEYGENDPYYTGINYVSADNDFTTLKYILPKIKPHTIFEIEMAYTNFARIEMSDFKIYSTT